MELWDIYDAERNKTGRTMVRGSSYEPGDFHLTVHVCIFNRKGEMLIQQRQPFKEGWPNLWDLTVGGSAVAGESSQSAAERETLEEIGLKIDLQKIRPHLTVNFDHGYDDIYLMEKDLEPDRLTLQYEEVRSVRWASAAEILSLIEQGEFLPYHPGLISLLFEMGCRYGGLHRAE